MRHAVGGPNCMWANPLEQWRAAHSTSVALELELRFDPQGPRLVGFNGLNGHVEQGCTRRRVNGAEHPRYSAWVVPLTTVASPARMRQRFVEADAVSAGPQIEAVRTQE